MRMSLTVIAALIATGSAAFAEPPKAASPRPASEQTSAQRGPLPLNHPSIEKDQQRKRGHRNQEIPQHTPLLDDWRRPHGRVARDQFPKQVVSREGRPLAAT